MIVTTHSPQVISSVKPENIFIFSDSEFETGKGRHTFGVESYRVLEDLFGVSSVPAIEEIDVLKSQYQEMIKLGNGATSEALELRTSLERLLGRTSPFLINTSAQMTRQKNDAR